jgi:hypothetical protein
MNLKLKSCGTGREPARKNEQARNQFITYRLYFMTEV